ncbi:hypothetical protein [Singulisphaera sp. PoT]|uniref:hypothetical protein n=1 Tax=Singulisphaera sp. PoT TaxID=3411797 RepID=UPI003BF4D031
MRRLLIASFLFLCYNAIPGCGSSQVPVAPSTEDTRAKEVRETDDMMQNALKKYQGKTKKR